jgi:hypothetical protein
MSKISEVLQRPDERSSQFYNHLCEAFHLTQKPLKTRMINAAFVGQDQGDIRQKLQKLEGFAGMNISQLLEVATKVFIN